MNDRKISVFDIITVLLEKKRFLIISLFIISVGAVTWTLLMQKYYTAVATLLPSKTSSISNPISALMGDLPINSLMKSFNFLGGSSDNDQLLTILESRRLAENVVHKFNLAQRYKWTQKKSYFIEDVITNFHRNYEVFETDLKNIMITFTDTNPDFSAAVVNYIIGELDSINIEISRNTAKNTRLFFEQRLTVVKEDMDSAHHRLAAFQEEHKLINPEQQILSSIDALSLVEANILSNDISTEFLKNRYGASSYEVQELKKNKAVLENRMKHYLDSGSGQLILSLKNAPRLSIEYAYLLRDVKVQEMLYGFLLQNYEQAKLTEANNTPTLNILEYAKVPQKKARPKRMIICLLCFSIGFIILSFMIMITKWYTLQRERDTDAFKKLRTMKQLLGKW